MRDLFAPPLLEVLAQAADDLLGENFEGFTNPEQSKHRERPARLDHLPVADAETVVVHVFLAQLAVGAQGSNPVTEGAKEPAVVGRQIPGGCHLTRLGEHEQIHHEHRCVFLS